MKILVLRGGAARRDRRPGTRADPASTRERGVLALGNGNGRWVLVNMSPAVAHQLDSDPRLDRHPGLADAEVRAVVLTDAQVDHAGGLLSLRGGAPIDLYATAAVFEQLTTALPVLPVLQHYCGVHWRVVPVAGDRRVASFRVEGLPTLEFTAVATQTALPPHLAQGQAPQVGDSIALAVRDLATGQRVFCAPGLARIGASEFEWMREADCVLLDPRPAAPDAAPWHRARADTGGPDDAPQAWLALLRSLPARHKVVFADAGLPADAADGTAEAARAAWADQGLQLAYDGLEIEL